MTCLNCSELVPISESHCTVPGIDSSAIPVVEGVKFLCDGSDLFNTILMGGQVRLEGLVFLLHGLQLKDLAVLVVLQKQLNCNLLIDRVQTYSKFYY